MATDDTSYGLLVSFPDQSPSFVHGYEAGMLWARMENGHVAEIDSTTHVENREVIARMAVNLGWDVEAEPTSTEGWDHTILRKTTSTPPRANPHGFRVVGGSHGQ